jgi:hypothetical protein
LAITEKTIVAQETNAPSVLEQIDLQVRCTAVVFVFDGR